MEKKDVSKKELLSVAEVAQILGYSRQHVLRLINDGKIIAQRIGRSYAINQKDIPSPLGEISNSEKKEVGLAVNKIFDVYGETIKKLGEE